MTAQQFANIAWLIAVAAALAICIQCEINRNMLIRLTHTTAEAH